MTPPAAVSISLFVALSAWCGCGGKVIVERGNGANAGGGDSAMPADDDDANGPNGSGGGGWGPKVDPCVSCNGWLDGCMGFGLCPDPSSACDGEADAKLGDLIECMCAGCAEVCGGSCVMFNAAIPACHACQTQILIHTCGIERSACEAE